MRNTKACLLALSLSGLPLLSQADANDYVIMPKVDAGEKEFDFKSGVERHKDGSSEAAHSLGLGYGFTKQWFSEVYAKYKRSANESQVFDAWEWENKFQLTNTDAFALIGFLLEIERPVERSEGFEVSYGPLIQKDFGRVQYNLNLLVQKHVQASQPFQTELHYQAQIKYKQSPSFQWGAQAFGNLGQYKHWSTTGLQEQKIGPAVFGKLTLAQKQAVKWNAAYLKGTTDTTPSATLRLQVEYEYY